MIKSNRAFHLLSIWSRQYLKNNENEIKLKFDESMKLGLGSMDEKNDLMIIGIKPYKRNPIFGGQHIKDADFVKIGVTVFHEITHHEQRTEDNIPEEIQLSELSKYMNPDYYYHNHHILPHEIDAEYGGIMKMWSKLEEEFPDRADELMLAHLTDRATKTIYMIDMPEKGFTSKEQVESLFEQAYETSLSAQMKDGLITRGLPTGYLKSDDEVARFISTEYHTPRLQYTTIYNKLTAPPSGEVMDRMMASLVSYIHPELQADYPDIDFDKLEPSHVFKVQMPETSEEIRERLGLDDDFTKAVESLNPNDSRLML